MNTPTTRSTVSRPAPRTGEAHAQSPDVAAKGERDMRDVRDAKGANASVETLLSPAKREAADVRIPKGPFKIMTIPQAWYDSLHAVPSAVGGAGKERG